MNGTNTPLKVFLCHALDDTPKTRDLYEYLKQRGVQPWFDKEDLLPGHDRINENLRALAASDVVVICLSNNSVNREGEIHREIKFAVEKALEMPEGQIFLIPVKFEKCEIPFVLRQYQWVDLYDENGHSKLMQALALRSSKLRRTPVKSQITTLSKEAKSSEKTNISKRRILETANEEPGFDQKPAPRSDVRSKERPKIEIKPEVWAAIIVSIATIVAALISSWGDKLTPFITPAPTFTQSIIPLSSNTPILPTEKPSSTLPSPTLSSTPYICPYQGQTEHETIVNLIKAEADAANIEDLDIINAIFAPNADFYDYDAEPPAHWNGTYVRYASNLFPKTEFKELEHFDILPAGSGIDGNTAYYTSGSKGSYRIGTGPLLRLDNGSAKSTRYGSDHWILEKNSNGCWIIVEMQFNAGDEKFP